MFARCFHEWLRTSILVRSILGSLAILCLSLAGCDDGLVSVTGTITVNGEPVGPGVVQFEPVNPVKSTARAANGHFGADGKYELMSAGRNKGIRPGEYAVMIHELPEGAQFGGEEAQPVSGGKIPRKYEHSGLTGLKATVEEGKNNAIDFDLKP